MTGNNTFRRIYYTNMLPFILLCTVATGLFLNTFMGEFVYDDLVVVVNNPEITQWSFWHGWGVLGRFTRTLSLTLDYKIFGNTPYGYHGQNILWHVLSTLLLYRVFLRLSKDRSVSFLGALFFAVHPIHVESVANISNRKDLLCMSFSLISFLSYINFVEGQKKVMWGFLFFVAWFLALNSKQVAIVLPFTFLIYEFLYLQKEKRWLLKRPLLLLLVVSAGAFWVLTLIFNAFDFSKISNVPTLGGHRGDLTYFSVAATSARAFWYYIKLLLFPFNLSPDYIIALATPFSDPGLIFYWCMLLIFLVSPFYLAKKSPLAAFGLFWFLIHYIPISNIIPLTYLVADRYMYIPSAGFSLIMAFCCVSLYRISSFKLENRGFTASVTCLIALIVIGYSITTFLYNSVWKNEETLWSHAVIVSPMSYKSYGNLGETYTKKGDFQKAIKALDRSLSIYPLSRTYLNRGNAFYYSGKFGEAVADYKKAIDMNPLLAEAYYGLGSLYIKMQEYDRAIENLSKAVNINPAFAQAYNNLGNAYNLSGNLVEALNSYSRAIELNPLYALAYKNRAYSYMASMDYNPAIKDYRKVIELGFASAAIYYNLGLVYSKVRDTENSYYFYKKAASLGDDRARAKPGSFGGSK